MAISVSATVAVVGATGGFATWTMYREIFSSTKLQQQNTLTRLFQDVGTYQEMLEPAEALERGGDKYSDLDTWVQVEDRQGNILFQSETLNQHESYASFVPPSPRVSPLQRSIVDCLRPVACHERWLGSVYYCHR